MAHFSPSLMFVFVCFRGELVNISCLFLGLAVVKISQTVKTAGLRLPLDVSALYVALWFKL